MRGISEEYLLVVGGAVPGEASTGSELITLDSSGNPLPDCAQSISPTPFAFMSSAGAALSYTGYPVICGSTNDPRDECWQYR